MQTQNQHGMDIDGPVAPLGTTPISSPKPRSSGSASADTSSNSVGSSSLDTASASAHLERYDVPWATIDLSMYRERFPRRTRSYNAFLEWQAAGPIARSALKHARPLAGASRRRLVKQIQQLTKDKADLQAQLAAMSSSSTFPSTSMAAVSSHDGQVNAAPILSSSSQVDPTRLLDGNNTDREAADGSARRDGTNVLPSMTLELIATLTDRLVAALNTSSVILLDENERALLERPGMRDLLQRSSQADPQRDQIYAEIFARRLYVRLASNIIAFVTDLHSSCLSSIEVQKKPELRSKALQPGPLQSSVKHPEYVDVLMQGLREPFIAHLGAFDDTELGLWILNGIQFHSEALGDVNIEVSIEERFGIVLVNIDFTRLSLHRLQNWTMTFSRYQSRCLHDFRKYSCDAQRLLCSKEGQSQVDNLLA